jgi:hypothetical protein
MATKRGKNYSIFVVFQYFTAHIYEFQFYKALCEISGQYVPGDKDKPLHRCNFYGKIRDASFFLGTTYQNGKNIPQMATKCTKWPQNVPNGRKIYQHIPLQPPPKFIPNWEFGSENKPSGNPSKTKLGML